MEMNDILNGLNSCDDDCCESTSSSCSCGPSFGGQEWDVFQEDLVKVDLVKVELLDVDLVVGFGFY